MLNIYRRIRRHLLEEGKLSRYLLYALGEIALVVVGILIALAINNYKERKGLRQKEHTYLEGLKSEFAMNEAKLEVLIEVNRQNFQEARTLLTYIDQPGSLPSEQEFSTLLIGAFSNDLAYNPNNSLLLEMINSGTLKDLENPELRKKLTNWLAWLEDISKQEEDLARQRERMIGIISSEDFSLRTVFDQTGITGEYLGHQPRPEPLSNLALLKSKTFENNVLLFLSTTQSTDEAHYIPLMSELRNIQGVIEQELSEHGG